MDTNTVLALCAIFTVVIGIVGLGRNKWLWGSDDFLDTLGRIT